MSFCTKCGNELTQSINFCPQCGEKQKTELESQTRQTRQTQTPQKIRKPKRVYATILVFSLFGIIYFALGIFMLKEKIELALIFLALSIFPLRSSYHLFKNNPVKLKYWSVAFIVLGIGSFAANYLSPNGSSPMAIYFFILLSLLPGLSDKPYKDYLSSLNKGEEQ